MTIRELHTFELRACLEGGHEFFSEGKLPGAFNEDHFLQTWNGLIQDGRGFILGMFEGSKIIGALAAVLSAEMFSGTQMATECFWFVHAGHRGHGMELLEAFEAIAINRGAKLISMIHLMNLQPEKLSALYQRNGYKEVERHFVKEVA